ncbi:oxygen-independent coproporphyrinogen-3 oxidase [Hathewaya proteolytica DSM 3090]|uniref:Oxygen-independent coproporphyrinogen-3 oxidase n=1 Tax=Hathewaya proteolytica DSM 3090 TaxID=1121331 RepID=A0A1M6P7N4_9CLOT|nr:coproporphyrinogen III oxidase [Hathewaya proteolytica]SHK03997.1 oxygen-independent coproporphyrinogen-3 oxidase [Hathewaya proteolytica DSM 3090]
MIKKVEYRQKLNVRLNKEEYKYDVFQMINLYLPFCHVEFSEQSFENNTDTDINIDIDDEKIEIESMGKMYAYIVDKRFTLKEEVKKAVFKYFSKETNKYMPWGTLIGIRPSKRAMKLLVDGKSHEEIIQHFKDVALTSEEKAKLCIEVAKREMKYIHPQQKKVSLYIGMAFCPTRCLYCSFAANPIAGFKHEIIEAYVDCLCREIGSMASYITQHNLQIHTVYFGGGTPTSVDELLFERVMKCIHHNLLKDHSVSEFTVECGRPDSISGEKLSTMKKYGVSRISINPQSMNDDTLKLIGRNHTSEQIKHVFKMARQMEFNDINMDIIVGLPGEKLHHIEKTLECIKSFKPDSFTVHGLSVKRASRLYDNIINDVKYEIASQDELNKMFISTAKCAKEMNMKPYYMYRQKNMVGNMENIGYSIHGKESVYNIEMMEDRETIIAIGADAVTKVVNLSNDKIERFGNVKDVKLYIDRIEEMIEKKIQLLDTIYS